MSAGVLGDEGAGSGEGEGLLADINVTPLVDVVLVLLIIFMITAPMMTMSVAVELPEVSSSAPAQRSSTIITLGEEGSISVDGRIVSLEQAIEEVHSRRAGSGGEGAVYLRGDRGVPYGFVMSMLDALRVAGIPDVELVTQPLPAPAEADSVAPPTKRRR